MLNVIVPTWKKTDGLVDWVLTCLDQLHGMSYMQMLLFFDLVLHTHAGNTSKEPLYLASPAGVRMPPPSDKLTMLAWEN